MHHTDRRVAEERGSGGEGLRGEMLLYKKKKKVLRCHKIDPSTSTVLVLFSTSVQK